MTEPRTTLGREALTLLPPAVALLAVLEVATRHSAHHRELLLALLAVVLTQVLPGAVIWRLVRPVDGWLVEDLALGLAIGAATAVVGHLAGLAAGLPRPGGLLPLLLAVALVALPASRRRILSRRTVPLPRLWGVLVTVTFLGPLLALLTDYRSPLRFQGWARLYVDLPFHDALAGELMHHFPPHYPQSSLEPLTYHWFAHAWTAQVSTFSGTSLEVLLWRFNPALLLVAVPLLTAIVAVRVTRTPWAGPIAAAIAFLLPELAPWATTGVDTPLSSAMSPTQQFGMLLVVGVIGVLTVRWREPDARGTFPVLLLLLVITGGSKGSTLPVLVCGTLLATAAMAVCRDRARLRGVGLDALLAVVVLGLLSVFMFGGASGGVVVDLGEDFVGTSARTIIGHEVSATSLAGLTAGALGLLTLVLGAAAGLALPFLRATRTDPVAWFLLGTGAAGIGAFFALTHPGLAQGYFLKASQPAIAIAAAWGTVALFERVDGAGVRRLAAGGAVLGLVGIGASYLVGDAGNGLGRALAGLAVFVVLVGGGAWGGSRLVRTGARGALAVAAAALVTAPLVSTATSVRDWTEPPALVGPLPTLGAISSQDVRALRWLRNHSDPDDVVITNDHCLAAQGTTCDRRRFFVAGYAERRVLIEGWTYTTKAAELYAEHGSNEFSDDLFWDQDLLALNDGFIKAPTEDAARRLWNLGVRWVVVWRRAPHARDLAPWATRAHRGQTLTIYRLEPPAGT